MDRGDQRHDPRGGGGAREVGGRQGRRRDAQGGLGGLPRPVALRRRRRLVAALVRRDVGGAADGVPRRRLEGVRDDRARRHRARRALEGRRLLRLCHRPDRPREDQADAAARPLRDADVDRAAAAAALVDRQAGAARLDAAHGLAREAARRAQERALAGARRRQGRRLEEPLLCADVAAGPVRRAARGAVPAALLPRRGRRVGADARARAGRPAGGRGAAPRRRQGPDDPDGRHRGALVAPARREHRRAGGVAQEPAPRVRRGGRGQVAVAQLGAALAARRRRRPRRERDEHPPQAAGARAGRPHALDDGQLRPALRRRRRLGDRPRAGRQGPRQDGLERPARHEGRRLEGGGGEQRAQRGAARRRRRRLGADRHQHGARRVAARHARVEAPRDHPAGAAVDGRGRRRRGAREVPPAAAGVRARQLGARLGAAHGVDGEDGRPRDGLEAALLRAALDAPARLL